MRKLFSEGLKDTTVFLETNKLDKDNRHTYLFRSPVAVVSCRSLQAVRGCFCRLEDFVSKGYYAAGFVSYEAGYAFENISKKQVNPRFPLLWFGIYESPDIFAPGTGPVFPNDFRYNLSNTRASTTEKNYLKAIRYIKHRIRCGDTYQVDYTFKYGFDFKGRCEGLYRELREKQSVAYSALIKIPGFSVLSFSPELFFRRKGNVMEMKPMKGTWHRGRDCREDLSNAAALASSEKNRSENIMIVDLLRNDLGRIAQTESVTAPRLFEVEKYETLFQMVSGVKGRLRKGVTYYDIFKALFPSGSVTGAPKFSTMGILQNLETGPRGVYTGCIGFISPGNEAVFNVAIRTVLLDTAAGRGELGVGSGIVYDSVPVNEFEECKLKALFLTNKSSDFKIIESVLWEPRKGYFLLDIHMKRLFESARYFNFPFVKKAALNKLKEAELSIDRSLKYKVRLLLSRDGRLETDLKPVIESPSPALIRFSEYSTSREDAFLYHKTTQRTLYDKELKSWQKKGYWDIVFTNEKGEVTEGGRSNIFIKKGRFYYTPPVECGLLNGVYRRYLLQSGKLPVSEKILYKNDIGGADRIYMTNSVRGMVEVRLKF